VLQALCIFPQAWNQLLPMHPGRFLKIADGVCVAVHSADQLGLMMVFENKDPQELLQQITALNPSEADLYQQCHVPNGPRIRYDLQASQNKWVIIEVDEKMMERNFEKWPLIHGWYPPQQ